MTAEEKAKDLIEKFNSIYSWDGVDLTKECALICVDEILEECLDIKESYWQEVKQEINKL